MNDHNFETGLSWLERRVALKQAQLRGFFTYGDLAAAGGGAVPLAELLGAGAGLLALVLGYFAGLLALVASTALVAPPGLMQRPTAPAPHDHTLQLQPDLTSTQHIPNSTIDLINLDSLSEEPDLPDKIMCCSKWLRHQESTPKRNWFDSVILYDWKSSESWWSTTSVFNWLYQSSLVNPMQRWLERLERYADLFSEPSVAPRYVEQCQDVVGSGEAARCVRQWLNLSKLGAWMLTVSDR